jgi:hypothetical protein
MAVKSQRPALATKGGRPVERRDAVDKGARPAGVTGKPEVRIFISYSHHDAAAQAKLNTHLAPWRRDSVTVWYDENIEPGSGLNAEIARKLRQAHIFVALFSPAYLESHYCWDIEYKRAMGRRARKLIRVIAVVVKPCGWKQTRAAGFKLLPKDGIPPERWSSSDAAYLDAAEGIGTVIKAVRRELTAGSAGPDPDESRLTRKSESKPPLRPATGKSKKVVLSKRSEKPASRSRKAPTKR